MQHLSLLAKEKKVDRLIVGMPLLPRGAEGAQSAWTQKVVLAIQESVKLSAEFVDERYTSVADSLAPRADSDAKAACDILTVWMERNKAIDM